MSEGNYRPTPEELEAQAMEGERVVIEAIRDPFERVKAMRESDAFEDKEVRDYIATLRGGDGTNTVQKTPSLKTRVMLANGDLYGHPEWGKPQEEEPLPTSQELYGGQTTTTVTDSDGTTFTRPASPEEIKRMRRAEVLAIKDQRERVRAIAANIDAFR